MHSELLSLRMSCGHGVVPAAQLEEAAVGWSVPVQLVVLLVKK